MLDNVLFTLLNTRPEHQAKDLEQAVVSLGGVSIKCPTLKILPYSKFVDDKLSLQQSDIWVFTSINAVEHWYTRFQFWDENWHNKQILAIGTATHKSLEKILLKFQNKNSKTDFFLLGKLLPLENIDEMETSEVLLQHSLLQAGRKTVAIIKGVGGRTILNEVLSQRGFKVNSINVYERIAMPLCKKPWLEFKQGINPFVLATSFESLQVLKNNLKQNNATQHDWERWVLYKPLITFGQRIANLAIQQELWHGKVLVSEPNNKGILKSIMSS